MGAAPTLAWACGDWDDVGVVSHTIPPPKMNQSLLDRRSALKSIAGVTLTAAAGIASAREFPPGDYVDVHTHLGQTWNTTEPLTAEALLRTADVALSMAKRGGRDRVVAA